MKVDNSLLRRLLTKGHIVSISDGMVCLETSSESLIPDDWLSENGDQLIIDAATILGVVALRYEAYSTGNYGEHRKGGLTLQFSEFASGSDSHVIFNADLTRVRNGKRGSSGSPLPKGQFRIGRKSHFYKFWKNTDLKIPPRLSSFHDYMGNLKQLVFTGEYGKGDRLDASTLRPLNVTHQQLVDAASLSNIPDNSRTTPGQTPDNCQTRSPYKETPEIQQSQGLRPFSTACKDNYGTSKQVDTDRSMNVITMHTHKRPIDQSTEEWLRDYGE